MIGRYSSCFDLLYYRSVSYHKVYDNGWREYTECIHDIGIEKKFAVKTGFSNFKQIKYYCNSVKSIDKQRTYCENKR